LAISALLSTTPLQISTMYGGAKLVNEMLARAMLSFRTAATVAGPRRRP